MKAAVTVWDGRVSPVFDVSREVVLLTVESGKVTARCCASIETPTPSRKLDRLAELGVETLICGAISEPLHRALTDRGVKVLGFVAGDINAVTLAFVAGRLPAAVLSMPGCCGQQKKHRGSRGGGRCNGWGPKGPQ
jgi:predicted Fe-Mo cluster-binding NifX family protein